MSLETCFFLLVFWLHMQFVHANTRGPLDRDTKSEIWRDYRDSESRQLLSVREFLKLRYIIYYSYNIILMDAS